MSCMPDAMAVFARSWRERKLKLRGRLELEDHKTRLLQLTRRNAAAMDREHEQGESATGYMARKITLEHPTCLIEATNLSSVFLSMQRDHKGGRW